MVIKAEAIGAAYSPAFKSDDWNAAFRIVDLRGAVHPLRVFKSIELVKERPLKTLAFFPSESRGMGIPSQTLRAVQFPGDLGSVIVIPSPAEESFRHQPVRRRT